MLLDEEDLPRVDFLFEPAPEAERTVLDRLLDAVDSHDLILIADQAETDTAGVVTNAVRKLIAELAPVYRDKVFLADSRRRAPLFRRVLLKANRAEAEAHGDFARASLQDASPRAVCDAGRRWRAYL